MSSAVWVAIIQAAASIVSYVIQVVKDANTSDAEKVAKIEALKVDLKATKQAVQDEVL